MIAGKGERGFMLRMILDYLLGVGGGLKEKMGFITCSDEELVLVRNWDWEN